MASSMDFWKDETFLKTVKKNWDVVGWTGANKFYTFFEFTAIFFVRPEKKSPNQFTGFFAQFDFKNKTVSFKTGESNKLNPPSVGILLEGDIQAWEESFKIGNFKPIKSRTKILLNSADNMQLTSGGLNVLPVFVSTIYRSLLELNLLSEWVKPKQEPDITLTQEEFKEVTKEILEEAANQVLTCPNCATVSKGDIRQCPKCGAQLPVDIEKYANMLGKNVGKVLDEKNGKNCPKCGNNNAATNKFCIKCGNRL
jgi:RNA polymerase subunit RPABC4/transcription elongation factor Spt4